jgi:ubiquinone/menaquinone biosynthesis C-methylase UbiE
MRLSFDSNARGCYDGAVSDRVDYDERQHEVYDSARAPLPAARERWREVLGRYLRREARPAILDLGCGTGAYSEWLDEAFDATVIGVEPSARMRAVAEREHAHPRVRYLDGSAERIPLANDSCDAALLSNVLHHVQDLDACLSELGRVIRSGGLVLVRGSLRGSRVPFLDYFPAARPIARDQSPPVGEVVAAFSEGGFEHVASEVVDQETSPSFRDYYERVRLRAISTLELIGDDEFEQGIERMRRVAEAETESVPVIEQIDLVVFRRSA